MDIIAQELRVMHACENGAVGVYRGHKCVARYFFRRQMKILDEMKFHEKEHSTIFSNLLKDNGYRKCYLSGLWFWGGLIYGVTVGVFGLKAIGISTSTIESIVDIEIERSLKVLEEFPHICAILRDVQAEERAHAIYGKSFAEGVIGEKSIISRIAKAGAYAAKNIAINF